MIGPNGAGKSTALRALAGLVPYEGSLGQALAGIRGRELASCVAYVPQSPQLPAEMNVWEYACLGRTPHLGYLGRSDSDDEHAVRSALDRLDLSDMATRRLGTLSGGERQRVVLARALTQQARVLLLDEPTSALDVGRQQDVLELVGELRRDRSLTVVGALHDLTLAGQYADELLLLDHGRAAAAGPPGTVLCEPLLNSRYRARLRVGVPAGHGLIVTPCHPEDSLARCASPPAVLPESPGGVAVRALMVQGCTSSAGKSLIATVLCRHFARLGVRVAPFKGQNMSNHARVGEGGEMGAAQYLAAATLAAVEHQLVVLDEITYPLNWGWIEIAAVVNAIRERPEHVNVILTERDAPAELIEMADTVTEMVKVRHAYDRGVRAKRGLDF